MQQLEILDVLLGHVQRVNMKLKQLNKSGLSLIEIVLAAVLFSFSVAGFYTALQYSQSMQLANKKAVAAARYAQLASETIKSGIASDTWDGANFAMGVTHQGGTYSDTETYATYNVTYTVECEDTPCLTTSPRKLIFNTSYN